MKLKGVLMISAIYLGVLGIGFMLASRQIGIDAVPADASTALIAYLRIFGGPILGIAVLNWITRNAEPSTARNGVVLGTLMFSQERLCLLTCLLMGDPAHRASILIISRNRRKMFLQALNVKSKDLTLISPTD